MHNVLGVLGYYNEQFVHGSFVSLMAAVHELSLLS